MRRENSGGFRGGRERRFKKDTNHVISKQVVSKAKGTTRLIALEDLKDIRSRVVTVTHGQRDRHGKWAFSELRSFIEYKARMNGVPLVIVDPRNTSRECPKCHTMDKKNRPERNLFRCIECGFSEEADYVAARNIAARAVVVVNQPIVAPTLTGSCKPMTLVVGS